MKAFETQQWLKRHNTNRTGAAGNLTANVPDRRLTDFHFAEKWHAALNSTLIATTEIWKKRFNLEARFMRVAWEDCIIKEKEGKLFSHRNKKCNVISWIVSRDFDIKSTFSSVLKPFS